MLESSAPELIIFDCDGVLVDSETLAAQVSQRILADLGCTMSIDQVLEEFAGASTDAYRARVAEIIGHPLEPGWDDDYHEWYASAFRSELRAIPGVRVAVASLSVQMCVASNSTHRRIREALDRTELLRYFDGRIFSAEDVERGKPAPDVFLRAAEQMGVHPDRCVVVEDSIFGVRAARAAGMRVLAYCGTTRAERLSGERTVTFHDMTELPGMIEGLTRAPDESPAHRS